MIQPFDDEYFMRQALMEAEYASEKNEMPVGAVVVADSTIIARAHNQTELLNDATAHAEMLALTSAAGFFGSKYLDNCTLYVTLEPCVMCIGATYWSQLAKIVFGARDHKRGFMSIENNLNHPKTEIVGGVMALESEKLLKEFFIKIRQRNNR